MENTPFVIRELEGAKRRIELRGRALPYRPFSLDTRQRLTTDWLPGTAEATGTVMGPSEEPTTVNGTWKDKYLLASPETPYAGPIQVNGAQVNTARDAEELFRSLVRMGAEIEVTWMTVYRRGFLEGFAPSWMSAHDLEWTMEFRWIASEPPADVQLTGTPRLSDTLDSLKDGFDKIGGIGVPKFELNFGLASSISGLVNSIGNSILAVEDGIVNFTNQALAPVLATRGLIATLGSIVDECRAMRGFLEGSVAGALNSSTPVEEQGYSQKMDAELYREELEAWARYLEQLAARQKADLELLLDAEIEVVHLARAGQDLRIVSELYYGSPDEWQRLMLFNGLRNAELSAGQRVNIPRRASTQVDESAGGG